MSFSGFDLIFILTCKSLSGENPVSMSLESKLESAISHYFSVLSYSENNGKITHANGLMCSVVTSVLQVSIVL